MPGRGRGVVEGNVTDGGEDVVFVPTGETPNPNPIPGPTPIPGPNPTPRTGTVVPGASNTVEVEVDVSARIVMMSKNQKRWYRVILRPGSKKKSHYAAVTLSFVSGTDNNREESLRIEAVDNLPTGALFDSSKISNLNVQQQCAIDVLFTDSYMHTVKVRAHEYKRK